MSTSVPKNLEGDKIWHRVGHVEIYIWNNDTAETFDFEGLDFKFKLTQILGRMPEGNMNVNICGLSLETANKIVTVCSVADALKRRKTVKLYAGYADPKNPKYRGELLATMDIINASITTSPPDIWLQITAVYAGWLSDFRLVVDEMNIYTPRTWGSNTITDKPSLGTGFTWSEARPVLIDDVMEAIVKGLNALQSMRGVTIQYDYDTTQVQIFGVPGSTRHFRFEGTLSEMTTKLSEVYRVNVIWEERNDNKIWLVAYPDPRYSGEPMTEADKQRFAKGNTVKFLDVEHGLIGIPKLKDSLKLECRCFLDGKLQAGDFVTVRSELMPVIYERGGEIVPKNKQLAAIWGNGKTIKAYQIMRITYTGHIRGNEWYCDIEGRAPVEISNLKLDGDVAPTMLLSQHNYTKETEDWEINEKTGAMKRKAQ